MDFKTLEQDIMETRAWLKTLPTHDLYVARAGFSGMLRLLKGFNSMESVRLNLTLESIADEIETRPDKRQPSEEEEGVDLWPLEDD